MKLSSILMSVLLAVVMIIWPFSDVRSHCEIPCGIYDDTMRYDMLSEHIATMEKSMNQITELSAAGDKNYNQLVRWVVSKEDHADKFMEIVTQYFLTQRIKVVAPETGETFNEYVKHLTYFHQMLVYAMKCKQTTDLTNIEKLKELVGLSQRLYFKEP